MAFKIRLMTVAMTLVGLGALLSPAQAMHCYINGQPELTDACNRVIGIVCGNPKLGPCG